VRREEEEEGGGGGGRREEEEEEEGKVCLAVRGFFIAIFAHTRVK
jgi:hypothetical protein